MLISEIEISDFKKFIYAIRNPKDYCKIDSIFPVAPHYNDINNFDEFIKQFNCDNLFDIKTKSDGYTVFHTSNSEILFNPYTNKYLIFENNRYSTLKTSNISLLGKKDLEFIYSLNFNYIKKFLKTINVSFIIDEYSSEFRIKINKCINKFNMYDNIDKFELGNILYISYYDIVNIIDDESYFNETNEGLEFCNFIKELPYVKDLIVIPLKNNKTNFEGD